MHFILMCRSRQMWSKVSPRVESATLETCEYSPSSQRDKDEAGNKFQKRILTVYTLFPPSSLLFFSLSKSKVEPFSSSCSQPAPISSSLISDLTGISRGSPLMGSHASKCGFAFIVKQTDHIRTVWKLCFTFVVNAPLKGTFIFLY